MDPGDRLNIYECLLRIKRKSAIAGSGAYWQHVMYHTRAVLSTEKRTYNESIISLSVAKEP